MIKGSKKISKCVHCGRIRKIRSKGYCGSCYTNHGTKIITCAECGEKKHHQARGFCNNCYKKLFFYDNIRASNLRRYCGNISYELWKEVTKECYSCGFNKVVQMHHIDHNRKNNSKENLVGLCPNCHKLIHMEKYRWKMIIKLERKGMIF